MKGLNKLKKTMITAIEKNKTWCSWKTITATIITKIIKIAT